MKIRMRTLKQLIREETVRGSGVTVTKTLNDLLAQFSSWMQSEYPGADDVINEEAGQLKRQLIAQIKASATKVKMGASSSA